MERKISLLLNLSEGLMDGRSRSRRAIMILWESVRTDPQVKKMMRTLFVQK